MSLTAASSGNANSRPIDGRQRQHPVALLAQPGKAAADRFANAFGQPPSSRGLSPASVATFVERTGFAQMPQHFADEERVPFCIAGDELGQRLRTLSTDPLPMNCRTSSSSSPLQRDARDAFLTAQIGQHFGERMRSWSIRFRGMCRRCRAGFVRRAEQMAQEQDGGAIGPVEIFEDQQQRPCGAMREMRVATASNSR